MLDGFQWSISKTALRPFVKFCQNVYGKISSNLGYYSTGSLAGKIIISKKIGNLHKILIKKAIKMLQRRSLALFIDLFPKN